MPKHPFLDPESFLDYGLKVKDYKPKAKPDGLPPNGGGKDPTPPDTSVVGTGSIRKNATGNFLFFDVPYQGRVIECIERPMNYIDSGNTKTQTAHLKWLADQKNNPEGFTLADSELEYQLCRMSFNLRADGTCGALANEYITTIRELYNNWIVTADHIQYGSGLEAVITNKGSIASKPKSGVIIPTYNGDHVVLSDERPETELDTIKPVDQKTNTFLKQYLGVGSEHAGKIFPYCATRKGTNLRETQLWAPNEQDRARFPERVGGLGFYGRFSINANVYIIRRALVVAVRAKKSP